MTRIRLIQVGDDDVVVELRRRNRAYLAPSGPAHPGDTFTLAWQQAEIRASLARHERGEEVPFVIVEDEDEDEGTVVGRVTLSRVMRGPFQSCAVGYWVSQDRGGRGVASAAVAAALEVAFGELGLHRVQAETFVSNVASQRVLDRNGFTRIGIAREYLFIDNAWQDHILFERLAER